MSSKHSSNAKSATISDPGSGMVRPVLAPMSFNEVSRFTGSTNAQNSNCLVKVSSPGGTFSDEENGVKISLESISRQLGRLTETVDSQAKEIKSLKKKSEFQATEIKNLKKTIDDKDKKIEFPEHKIDGQEKTIKSLVTTTEVHTKQLEALEGKNELLQNANKSQQEKIETLQEFVRPLFAMVISKSLATTG